MKIVTENYAESLGAALGQSGDGFLAAVIGERLRADLADEAELPDQILILVQSLDRPPTEHPSGA
jgi:hypothetical protein